MNLMLKGIVKIRIKDLDDNSSGVFIERLNKDCNELSHIFTMGVGNLTGILSNIGVFIAVFIINKWIFLFYLFISIIITLLHLRKVKQVNIKDIIFQNILWIEDRFYISRNIYMF